ncbi:hypothetical protein EON83_17380 [bacterium]|nr:MAG: hypothetical protein EON83_17380 [bacterium]
MVKDVPTTPESSLKKPLSRTQSIGIIGGFGALLLILAIFMWMRPTGSVGGPPPTPVEMPAVMPQGFEEPTPLPPPPPSSHEEAVRRENLQALTDQARSAPVEN